MFASARREITDRALRGKRRGKQMSVQSVVGPDGGVKAEGAIALLPDDDTHGFSAGILKCISFRHEFSSAAVGSVSKLTFDELQ